MNQGKNIEESNPGNFSYQEEVKDCKQNKGYKSRKELYEGKTPQEILILKEKFAAQQKKYRENHKEQDFAYHKKYRQQHRDKIYSAVKKYRDTHRNVQPKSKLEGTYYSRNKEKVLNKYNENKEKVLSYAKEYYAKNKENILIARKEKRVK